MMMHEPSYCKDIGYIIAEPPKNSEFAYFLGLLLGDGCLSTTLRHQVIYSSNDMELIQEFKRLGHKLFDIDGGGISGSKKCKSVKFCSKAMWNYLATETDFKKEIPEWIVEGSDEIISAFIRGFADAEGSVLENNKAVTIVIAQKEREILVKIQYMLHKLGIFSRVCVCNNNGVHAVRICNHTDVTTFMSKVSFGLTRKRDKVREVTRLRKMPVGWGDLGHVDKRAVDLTMQIKEWSSLGLLAGR